jgi:dTDP-4-dehydrorhamnose reductase
MTTYNGWTNYATWRVNLEMFDGMSARDVTGRNKPSAYDLSEALKDMATETLESSGNGLALDYALTFLSEVNWAEIAKHMLENANENETENEEA